MTRIAYFKPREEEKAYIRQWSDEHQVQVDTFNVDLHEDNLSIVKGYDGVLLRQRTLIGGDGTDERLYRILKSWGLKQLSVRSAGIDEIDLQAAKNVGLTVTNVPSYSPSAIAQLVLALSLQLIRHLPQFHARTKSRDFIYTGLMSREIQDLTVGVIGVGRIGSETARIFHALGATVLGNDIVERQDPKRYLEYVSKEELLRRSDVITLHTWLDASTIHLIDEQRLSLIKPSAILINASRGPIVDTQSLIKALDERRIAGVGLDVLEGEERFLGSEEALPSSLGYRAILERYPNVVLTPHIAFFTDRAVRNSTVQGLDDVLAVIEGRQSPHVVHV